MSIKFIWAFMMGIVAIYAMTGRDTPAIWVILTVLMLAGLVF